MVYTLGFTGMDRETEALLRDAFERARGRLDNGWALREDGNANFVIVDMDSMYGPMSWLRLHADGIRVIGLTASPRTQTPYRLGYPIHADSLAELLQQITRGAEMGAVSPSGLTPSPQPQDMLPEELPPALDEEHLAPSVPAGTAATDGVPMLDPREPPSAAAGLVLPAAPSIEPHAPTNDLQRKDTLVDWLASGRLTGRVRLVREGTTLLLDTETREYFGPTLLKPLTPHFEGRVDRADLTPVDAGSWHAETSAIGKPQPLARLLWFGALLAGKGKLAAGFDPSGHFQLLKFPETEREFPKHFRIATMMMKGPATLPDIAARSGTTLEEVVDYVNASLATGFAAPADQGPADAEKSSGFFGRLRGR